jgi:hypothetical protein
MASRPVLPYQTRLKVVEIVSEKPKDYTLQ